MTVIETTNFAQDIASIDAFLKGKINQTTWQSEPLLADDKVFIVYKPILLTWKKDRPLLRLFFDEQTMEYHLADTTEINGEVFDTEELANSIEFVSKSVNSTLNTSVGVTFSYFGKQHTVTLADWAFWRVLTDEQCLSKVKKLIYKNNKI